MATAEQYAKWIVDNADKKGTPEFDTVAQAYKLARDEASQPVAPAAPQGATTGPTGMWNRLLGSNIPAPQYQPKRQWGSGADLSAYQLGGAATDLASKAGLPPPLAAGIGTAANFTAQAVPALIGGQMGKTVAPMMRTGAEELMGSALKPTIAAWQTGKAARAIDTLLNEGVNVTKGGVEKLRNLIDELNTSVKASIAQSPARIDASAAQQAIDQTLNKFKYQATPAADEKAIRAVWDEFKNTWLGSGDIPVQTAQSIKQGTQRTVSKAYGKLSDAETEAQKAIARGLREEIASKVPEVAGPLSRESDLINALNVTERRVPMVSNKDLFGLTLLSHDPRAWAAMMADKSALFKSIMARMLNAGQQRIPQAIGAGTGAAVGANSGMEPNYPMGIFGR